MDHFTVAALHEEREQRGKPYHEFLRVPAMSAGMYELAVGAADLQQPHSEDELYYVVAGQGQIRVGEEDQAVAAGSLVLVAAGMVHRFHSITEALSVLVVFAPAEYSQRHSEQPR